MVLWYSLAGVHITLDTACFLIYYLLRYPIHSANELFFLEDRDFAGFCWPLMLNGRSFSKNIDEASTALYLPIQYCYNLYVKRIYVAISILNELELLVQYYETSIIH